MEYVNVVKIVGQVCSEVQFSYTKNSIARAIIKVETKEIFNDRERVERHRVCGWGKVGEYMKDHISMGQWVSITGTLTQQSFKPEGKDWVRYAEIKAQPPIEILQNEPGPEDQSQEAAF